MKQEHESVKTAPSPVANQEHNSESIADLIRHLTKDLSTLLGKEIELAKAEVGESVSEAKIAIGAMATGAAVAMAGLVVLLMSAVYGLSNILEPWLAALVVGAAALLVGWLMVGSAKKKMNDNSMVPERTLESTKKDKDTLTRAAR
ncbi:MAG: phage holin family protein [Pseudohongiella sp.]|uniref:phage holin family protein n=1 Tax=Pseudohongiella sp. TaxID=1979412 RepID=UPI0034A00DA7